jgi:hypothetical protein
MSELYVGITGSRRGHTEVERRMFQVIKTFGRPALWVLGGARGVDTQAETVCRMYELPHAVLIPLYKRYGQYRAPKRRNEDMVEMVLTAPHRLFLAFPQSDSRGTLHCMGCARRAGVQLLVAREER